MVNHTRREFLGLVGAAGIGSAADRQQPNILYMMADDHAAHAISAYGSKINKTPNIDRLANEGVRLSNCFCTNSICTPSRAAILTGQYSNKNGVYTLDDAIDPNKNNVAKELQKAGYQTAMVGKWHLETDPSGFDYWNILPGQGVYYDPVFLTAAGKKKYTGYCTDLIADFSLDWLKAARSWQALLPHVAITRRRTGRGIPRPSIKTCSPIRPSPNRTTSTTTMKAVPAA